MPNSNINKFVPFVILVVLIGSIASGCGYVAPNGSAQEVPAAKAPFDDPVTTGKLESPDLREASGLAASKCQNGVLWTHNDSGDDALLFAIDTKGKHLGVWKVENAKNRDWEDIAAVENNGKCQVIIGDIGNNDFDREVLTIYRVDEPAVSEATRESSAKSPIHTLPAAVSNFKYPDERHNAEALLALPGTGELYIVTKSRKDPAHIYKFKPQFEGESETLEKVGDITVPAIPNGVITGGDIAPDGKRLVLCDYFAGYELTLPEGAKDFDEIWKLKPLRIDLGKREVGEAVAYSPDGNFIIAVSENKHTPVNMVQRKAN